MNPVFPELFGVGAKHSAKWLTCIASFNAHSETPRCVLSSPRLIPAENLPREVGLHTLGKSLEMGQGCTSQSGSGRRRRSPLFGGTG